MEVNETDVCQTRLLFHNGAGGQERFIHVAVVKADPRKT
jgi:hypothetical protein